MSGVADRAGIVHQTASADANEHLGKQFDTLEFCENLLGEESFGINGVYEESQAKSLQDCATGQPALEPATATSTSKSVSQTLPTHASDVVQEHGLESHQFSAPPNDANENTEGVNAQARPIADGDGNVQSTRGDDMSLFNLPTTVADATATASDNGKYFDTNVTTGEHCTVPSATLPEVPPGTTAEGSVQPTATEPFHADHDALHSLDTTHALHSLDIHMQAEGANGSADRKSVV